MGRINVELDLPPFLDCGWQSRWAVRATARNGYSAGLGVVIPVRKQAEPKFNVMSRLTCFRQLTT